MRAWATALGVTGAALASWELWIGLINWTALPNLVLVATGLETYLLTNPWPWLAFAGTLLVAMPLVGTILVWKRTTGGAWLLLVSGVLGVGWAAMLFVGFRLGEYTPLGHAASFLPGLLMLAAGVLALRDARHAGDSSAFGTIHQPDAS